MLGIAVASLLIYLLCLQNETNYAIETAVLWPKAKQPRASLNMSYVFQFVKMRSYPLSIQ